MKLISTILFIVALTVNKKEDNTRKNTYNETHRPQFHFTAKENWINAPTGLVYFEKQYHMLHQYNPTKNEKGSTSWGYTFSNNLLKWASPSLALYPKKISGEAEKDPRFSGSIIIDDKNLLNKQNNGTKTMVSFYTNKNYKQCIAYSTDKGKTWKPLAEKPRFSPDGKENARNPKVFWHTDSQKWIMVLAQKLTEKDNSRGVSIYTSKNLIDWEWQSHMHGFFECPDLIEFEVTNRPDEKKWALFNNNGHYILGSFDGKKFTAETGKMKSDWGKNYHTPQTFNNTDDGRIIQIASMGAEQLPNMPFSGQMSFPCELKVTKFPSGYKLVRNPVVEIQKLHGKNYSWKDKNIIPGLAQNKMRKVSGDCLHIIAEFDVKTSDNFGLILRHSNKVNGAEVLYNTKQSTLSVLGSTAVVPAKNNKLKLEILLDRSSIEVFANDGQVVISNCFAPSKKAKGVVLFTNGGELGIDKIDVYKIKSIWKDQ